MNKKKANFDTLYYPLLLLELIGQHPSATGRTTFVLATMLYSILYGIVIPTTMVQFLLIEGDSNLFAENFGAFGIYTQTFLKLAISGITSKKLFALMEDTKLFWTIDGCSPELQAMKENLLRRTMTFQKIFCTLLVTAVIIIGILPYFTKQLPMGIWLQPEQVLLYRVVLCAQELLIPYTATHTAAFDGIFMHFCIQVVIQFKILNERLVNLNVSTISTKADLEIYVNKLKSCIMHHQYLLRFLKSMQNYYSPIMLIICSMQVLILCGEMYMLAESKELALLARHFITMTAACLQLAFYCIASDFIANEAYAVADSIYNSDWHSQQVPILKTTIPLIIMRSQREVKFTAGGLCTMQSPTLVTLLKTAWSVCTVIRATKSV